MLYTNVCNYISPYISIYWYIQKLLQLAFYLYVQSIILRSTTLNEQINKFDHRRDAQCLGRLVFLLYLAFFVLPLSDSHAKYWMPLKLPFSCLVFSNTYVYMYIVCTVHVYVRVYPHNLDWYVKIKCIHRFLSGDFKAHFKLDLNCFNMYICT